MNAADIAIVRRYLGSRYPQTRVDYDADANAIYVGVAPRGALASESAWLIEKLTYTNGNMTLSQTSLENQIWDNRTTLTYG